MRRLAMRRRRASIRSTPLSGSLLDHAELPRESQVNLVCDTHFVALAALWARHIQNNKEIDLVLFEIHAIVSGCISSLVYSHIMNTLEILYCELTFSL